ncbi:Arginine deiminase [Candidatus Bilamarchaeum dharawalense]|uniref:Arginine deiminase n=1 Tax=Candidatus Bilamarchaeum dharawalense TaxID=2885759 RepID=A0A5E4LPH9_9ARCH|nr:Arginine deiminase [Candidatus Bilamarchaeum dharawalense]
MQNLAHATKFPACSGPHPVQKALGPTSKLTLVETINLHGVRVKCDSEDGQLKKVLVHPPNFLSWTPDSAINEVESTHQPPPISQVLMEHNLLVEALLGEGVDVIMVEPKPHLPEAVYQRDSIAVIGDRAFAAKFRFPVRQGEINIISGAESPWKRSDVVEFGDVLVFSDVVLVGISDRTNRNAAQTLDSHLDREIIQVPLKPGALHLDYTTTIGGRNGMRTMLACPELYSDQTSLPTLISRLSIKNVIIVPKTDYANGWTNVFFINPETVISTTASHDVNLQLKKLGFKVIELPFDGILTGQGAPRCCTAPLVRED